MKSIFIAIIAFSCVFLLQACFQESDHEKRERIEDARKERNGATIERALSLTSSVLFDSLKWEDKFSYEIQEECAKGLKVGMVYENVSYVNDIIKSDSMYIVSIPDEYDGRYNIRIKMNQSQLENMNGKDLGFLVFETESTDVREILYVEQDYDGVYGYKKPQVVIYGMFS